MQFTGRYEIPADPDAVWQGLNDPSVLKACIPGCEEITKTSPTDFLAVATLKIGPVKARFRGKVTLSDLDPPSRCKLSGEGQGGIAGFAKGNAEITLAPANAGTVLSYTAQASVGGKLAQIGQRLIDGAARQIADDFFNRFASLLTDRSQQSSEPLATLETDTNPSQQNEGAPLSNPQVTGSTARDGLSPEIWVVGLIGVVVILLLLFSVSL